MVFKVISWFYGGSMKINAIWWCFFMVSFHGDVYHGYFSWSMSGCATRLAKSKQPLSHSATLPEQAGPATQPLSRSGKSGWTSLSVTQSGWVAGLATLAEWLSGWSSLSGRAEPLSGWSSLSGRVAEWLRQIGCHSATATQPLWQSGWRSHSATQPLWVTEWLSGWRAIGV